MKYSDGLFNFWRLNLIILLIFASLFMIAVIKNSGFIVGGLIFGTLGYFFLVIDHIRLVEFDKQNDKITIKDKALLFNSYKIRKEYKYSDLVEILNSKDEGCYSLELKLRNPDYIENYDGEEEGFSNEYEYVDLFTFGSGVKEKSYWQSFADEVNSFMQTDEPILTISRSPSLYRYMLGIPISCLYLAAAIMWIKTY